MPLGFVFWVVMLVTLVLGLAVAWPRQAPYHVLGGSLLWWLLLAILGWATFGAPLRT